MANKFLDTIGLGHLWLRIKENFVKKEEGKGLSSNDFTNDLLAKLNGIADNANNYTHPAEYESHESGLYKITVNAEGHVTNAVAATSEDLKGVIGKIEEGDLDTDLAANLHSHTNFDELKKIQSGDVEKWNSKAAGDHDHNSDYASLAHGHEISHVSGLQDALDNRYTKEEVNGLVSSALHYMGTKDSYSDLPTDAKIGDVWNIINADSANGIKAGDNVAWNGTGWDVLAGTVDLSAYDTSAQVDGKLANYVLATDYNAYVTEHEIAFEAVKATADAAATPDQIDSKIAALELGALTSTAIDEAIRAVDSEAVLG